MIHKIFWFVSAVVALIGVIAAGNATAGSMNLSRLALVGDSLSAGYQNSCLIAVQQVNGFASRVAERAATKLPLPLIEAPGAPPSGSCGGSTPAAVSEFYYTETPNLRCGCRWRPHQFCPAWLANSLEGEGPH